MTITCFQYISIERKLATKFFRHLISILFFYFRFELNDKNNNIVLNSSLRSYNTCYLQRELHILDIHEVETTQTVTCTTLVKIANLQLGWDKIIKTPAWRKAEREKEHPIFQVRYAFESAVYRFQIHPKDSVIKVNNILPIRSSKKRITLLRDLLWDSHYHFINYDQKKIAEEKKFFPVGHLKSGLWYDRSNQWFTFSFL